MFKPKQPTANNKPPRQPLARATTKPAASARPAAGPSATNASKPVAAPHAARSPKGGATPASPSTPKAASARQTPTRPAPQTATAKPIASVRRTTSPAANSPPRPHASPPKPKAPGRQRYAFEVKNYNVEHQAGRARLIRDATKQAIDRQKHLPRSTRQQLVIDVRGQKVSNPQQAALKQAIVARSKGTLSGSQVSFLRRVAKQSNTPVRPTWRQSERDVLRALGANSRRLTSPQRSFREGKKAPHGAGTKRPDAYQIGSRPRTHRPRPRQAPKSAVR